MIVARTFCLIALLSVVLTPAHAAPTAEERVLAEALFVEGKRLMKEEKWDEACPKLEESYRLEPLAGVLLNMAVCHEEQGLTATAWSEFKESLALAKIDRRKDREKLAQEHIDALEPQLARLVVAAPSDLAGLEVSRDGVDLPAAAWGTAVPVDPGKHTVRATAPGHQAFEAEIESVPGESVTVEVVLMPVPKPPPPAPVVVPPPAPVPPPPPPPPVLEATPWPVVGWTLTAVGIAAVAVGTGFGINAVVRENEAAEVCSDTTCPDAASLAVSDEAETSALAADVLLAAGALFAVSGVLVLVIAPAEVEVSPTSASLRVRF